MRASLTAKSVPREVHDQIIEVHERNAQLGIEISSLEQKLQKAKAVRSGKTLAAGADLKAVYPKPRRLVHR